MVGPNELLICASDAESLALILGERRRIDALEAAAADALFELLSEARLLPDGELPPERVAMRSEVLYQEHPGERRRAVVLAYPEEANATRGRISVLSPVGLALLGRAPGVIVAPAMPAGRVLSVRILETAKAPHTLGASLERAA